MPIRITKRQDGRVTLSGLEPEQVDAMLAGLVNARISYRSCAGDLRVSGKLDDALLADRLMDRSDVIDALAQALKPHASPVERDLAG